LKFETSHPSFATALIQFMYDFNQSRKQVLMQLLSLFGTGLLQAVSAHQYDQMVLVLRGNWLPLGTLGSEITLFSAPLCA
jgi:hypothetical protein